MTSGDLIQIAVYKNDELMFRILANDGNSGYDMSSNFGVSECEAGDVVWVLVDDGGGFFSGHTSGYHSFSGFLLNKL